MGKWVCADCAERGIVHANFGDYCICGAMSPAANKATNTRHGQTIPGPDGSAGWSPPMAYMKISDGGRQAGKTAGVNKLAREIGAKIFVKAPESTHTGWWRITPTGMEPVMREWMLKRPDDE